MANPTALRACGTESATEAAKRLATEARVAAETAAGEAVAALSQAAALAIEVAALSALPDGERQLLERLAKTINDALDQRQAIRARKG